MLVEGFEIHKKSHPVRMAQFGCGRSDGFQSNRILGVWTFGSGLMVFKDLDNDWFADLVFNGLGSGFSDFGTGFQEIWTGFRTLDWFFSDLDLLTV